MGHIGEWEAPGAWRSAMRVSDIGLRPIIGAGWDCGRVMAHAEGTCQSRRAALTFVVTILASCAVLRRLPQSTGRSTSFS